MPRNAAASSIVTNRAHRFHTLPWNGPWDSSQAPLGPCSCPQSFDGLQDTGARTTGWSPWRQGAAPEGTGAENYRVPATTRSQSALIFFALHDAILLSVEPLYLPALLPRYLFEPIPAHVRRNSRSSSTSEKRIRFFLFP